MYIQVKSFCRHVVKIYSWSDIRLQMGAWMVFMWKYFLMSKDSDYFDISNVDSMIYPMAGMSSLTVYLITFIDGL